MSENSLLWICFVGGFIDFWGMLLVHPLIWLSLLFLRRYLYIVRPLVIRAQFAKVSFLLVSGTLGDFVLETPETAPVLQDFFAIRYTTYTLLRMCILPIWIARNWVELIPPG